MSLLLLILVLSDSVRVNKETIENKWQVYIIGDLGSYSKFNLKELDINVPINKYANPLRPTTWTSDLLVQKDKKSFLLGMKGFSNEALYIKPESDTLIDFLALRLIGQYELWTNKMVFIIPKLGFVVTEWSRARWDEASQKRKDREGETQVGLLAGTNFRLQQEVSPSKKWTPFIEGTYDYSTPFSGINRAFFEGGITFLNVADPRGKEEGMVARIDVGIFKGYTFGKFIEGEEQGIGFKFWFAPRKWFY